MRAAPDPIAGRRRILATPRNVDFLLGRRTAFLRRFLDRGDRVLEVGAGLGTTALYVPGIDLTSTDIAPQSWLDDVADAQRLQYEDDSFDAVVALHVLHHLPSPRRALAEMVRVVRPGGALLIAVTRNSTAGRAVLRLSGHEYVDESVDPLESDACQTRPEFPGGGNNAIGDGLFGDVERFECAFPELRIVHHVPTECLTFVNSGGVGVRGPHVPLPRALLRLTGRADDALMRWPGTFAICREVALRYEPARDGAVAPSTAATA
jgi:SAM-dependent methyltransferase